MFRPRFECLFSMTLLSCSEFGSSACSQRPSCKDLAEVRRLVAHANPEAEAAAMEAHARERKEAAAGAYTRPRFSST